ncbi:MAG: RNA pseudouridine synthase [Planctomycetota bacterium]
MSKLDVIYHEGPCIVANKPPGILTQSPPGIDSLERLVREYVKQRENKDGKIYLGVPHRLDRPASGAIVFGRHIRATRRLSEQFEKRTVRKTYWALVPRSDNLPENGTWEDRLRKIPGRSFVEVVDANHPDGKHAVLHFRRVQDHEESTLLEIELETGRTHQIRVQLASRGFPILGDDQYGSNVTFGPAFDDPRDRAIALHARTLEFDHPMTKERVTITAETDENWPEFP